MKVYVILRMEDIIFVLKSRVIPFGTLQNPYVYKKIPKINNDEFIICFNIFNNELSYLDKISKGIYHFNKNISIEHRNIKILCVDKINSDKIKKLNNMYKEIKDIDYKNIEETINENNIIYSIPTAILKEESIINFEREQFIKFDKFKGLLYMFLAYFPDLAQILLDNNVMMYNYFMKVQDLINDLRDNNLLDRKIYNSSRRFINQLEKSTLINLDIIIDNKNFFKIDDIYKVSFESKELNLSNSEQFLFNYIFDFIINSKEINIKNLILNINNFVNSHDQLNYMSEDINIITDRIINQNYLNDINSIDSILLKNLYSFSVNYADAKSLYFFNKENQIIQSYLSFMLHGLCFGYSNITNALIFDNLIDSFSNKILLKSIHDIENICFDFKTNKQYVRDRLFFIILLIINDEDIFKNKFNNIDISTNKYNDIDVLEISNNEDSIIIEYYIRTKNMAKSIKYFDQKIEKLKTITKNNVLKENNFVFSYYFKKGKKQIPLNLDMERTYMVLLEYIYRVSKQ